MPCRHYATHYADAIATILSFRRDAISLRRYDAAAAAMMTALRHYADAIYDAFRYAAAMMPPRLLLYCRR